MKRGSQDYQRRHDDTSFLLGLCPKDDWETNQGYAGTTTESEAVFSSHPPRLALVHVAQCVSYGPSRMFGQGCID